jgi:hypothetical protein
MASKPDHQVPGLVAGGRIPLDPLPDSGRRTAQLGEPAHGRARRCVTRSVPRQLAPPLTPSPRIYSAAFADDLTNRPLPRDILHAPAARLPPPRTRGHLGSGLATVASHLQSHDAPCSASTYPFGCSR